MTLDCPLRSWRSSRRASLEDALMPRSIPVRAAEHGPALEPITVRPSARSAQLYPLMSCSTIVSMKCQSRAAIQQRSE